MHRLFWTPAAWLLSSCAAVSAAPQEQMQPVASTQQGAIITILGTAGGPPPHPGRAQPSTLLTVDGKRYLIDAGEGTGYQLQQAGTPPGKLNVIFITHLHWDHVLGLDYLMAVDWMRGRTAQLPIYGPPGLDDLIGREFPKVKVGEAIFRAQASNRPEISTLYPTNQVASCGPTEIFRDDVVKVTSVCNSHFAQVRSVPHSYGEDRALSYRFDTKYGSVTFTGDTGPSADLEKLAEGSDVLVSEIVDLVSIEQDLHRVDPARDHSRLMVHMAHQHLTAEELGKLATRARVKKLVLTHFVIGKDFNPEGFVAQLRPYFAGEIVVGQDLQRTMLLGK